MRVNLAGISFAYLRARPLASALNLLLLALGIAMITVLLLVSAQIEERMGRDARTSIWWRAPRAARCSSCSRRCSTSMR